MVKIFKLSSFLAINEVVRKVKSQWMLKITAYADKLLEGLEEVDYIEKVKTSQRNWIGRSVGAEVDFKIAKKEDSCTAIIAPVP